MANSAIKVNNRARYAKRYDERQLFFYDSKIKFFGKAFSPGEKK